MLLTKKKIEQMTEAERKELAVWVFGAGLYMTIMAGLYFVGRAVAQSLIWSNKAVETAIVEVEEATVQVQTGLDRMTTETTRAQRLAIQVGVATAIIGAVLGGFAGAFAAKLIGG